jgi:fructokinase
MNSAGKITCIGEVLVDFISTKSGVDLVEAPAFMKLAGGAPANVAVALAKLGARSAFVGKVGHDSFGEFLKRQLRQFGVKMSGLRYDDNHKTRLAFVSLTKSGERDFEFWERHPADEQLLKSDISKKDLLKSDIVHISSFLLLAEPSRSTIFGIAKELHNRNRSISFDPNLRLSLWKFRSEAKQILLKMVRLSKILRLNEDEAKFFTGLSNLNRSARKLLSYGPELVVITRGAKGCSAFTQRSSAAIDGFRVDAIDTTGCGDGFLAGLLKGILESNARIEELSSDNLFTICRYGNAVAALTAMKRGVITALPTSQEVDRYLSRRSSQ